jgi:hypothetical protein
VADFRTSRNRDAWFVIRGYKYQVDLSILRWLRSSKTQVLLLESGEDIDIVNNAFAAGADVSDRELEQVKHLDDPITLRSAPCRVALANACQHFEANPSLDLHFRFCTNATVTTERPSVFDDRKPAISVWESIRRNTISDGDRVLCLESLLSFLRTLERPSKGVDQESWSNFVEFLEPASLDDLAAFISRFEWSTRQSRANEVSREIVRAIQDTIGMTFERAQEFYTRLFLHVMQVLSQPGVKRLDQSTLESMSQLPPLSESNSRLLQLLRTQVLSQSVQLQELAVVTERHDAAIAGIQQRLEVQFGSVGAFNLSAAVSEIATSLPPQVGAIAKRQSVVSSLCDAIADHDWVALHGSIGSGKTQLATLIGEHIESLVYVSLRDLSSAEANFLLHHLFQKQCGDAGDGSITSSGLAALPPESAIILDDLPRLVSGDQLSRRLATIARGVTARAQTLITLSHFPLSKEAINSIQLDRLFETAVPTLDKHDVVELFVQHGAPHAVLRTPVMELFVQATSGNPTLTAAVAKSIQVAGWDDFEDRLSQIATSTSGEVAEETMFRLLETVESEEARELLYRLCVVTGAFGSSEIAAVTSVEPGVRKPLESYSSLHGLWIEKRSDDESVVCPLVAQFGAKQLDPRVERSVAATLADLVFSKRRLSPIEFAKAIGYLSRAKDSAGLGIHIWIGLESACELPAAWRRLIYLATTSVDLSDCPMSMAILIKARQLELGVTIDASIEPLIRDARELTRQASDDDMWAVLGYAVQAAPIVARYDIDEALRLSRIALNSFESVLNYRDRLVGKSEDDQLQASEFKSSFPWFLVSELKTAHAFAKWFAMISERPTEEAIAILSSDLAAQGMETALDQLWMVQHELDESERDFVPILEAYDSVRSFAERHQLTLIGVLALRAAIVVTAEYLHDLDRAVDIAEGALSSVQDDDECVFLIREALARQYAYAKHIEQAIEQLSIACDLDTGTFEGLRCRALMELSRIIGDSDSSTALEFAERAVAVAERSPHEVAELNLVSALGEAAIAAWFDDDAPRAFDYLDKAFVVTVEAFDESLVDWKMRIVLLGNALGYMASIAATGEPPGEDYTVPPRGNLLSYNEALSNWYDESDCKQFDLAPTLLVMFASAIGEESRAVFWANRGIDDARTKGELLSIYSLAEALIPTFIEGQEIDVALDYASECSIALAASMATHREAKPDIRERHDALEILGTAPNDDWSQAEQYYLFVGVLPSLLYGCVHNEGAEILKRLALHCTDKARAASTPSEFQAIAQGIASYLAGSLSNDLHSQALLELKEGHVAGTAAYYLLSSFSKDAPLERAVIQHAVVMHDYSGRIPLRSVLWKLFAEQLDEFWVAAFKNSRFRFSNPALIQSELPSLKQYQSSPRLKRTLRLMLGGLSIKLPARLKTTDDWLCDRQPVC